MKRVGPYTVIRPLGEGAFARTVEARHDLLGTKACLKIGKRPEDNDLLLKEARILWDLHHPSLPTLRDVFVGPDGGLVLAMRFVEGTPLSEAIPIDVPTSIQVLGRLLRALKVLHHRGVVHNDVKPANIILEPDRHGVVLVDFGMSSIRPRSSTVAPGFTPAFAAPEVTLGLPPLPESDLFSLGLSVLWALGGDIERRILPPATPRALLELLVALTRPEAPRRPRWDTEDPLRTLDNIMRGGSP